ncbi:MAG: MBL fold metallo-hydrolase [Phycisphaerales bacterium]|nr:MBL fold metallo-hydrolase [Phycisphaerales bacterium]
MPPQNPPSPTIRSCTLGPWETNCYVVSTPGSDECWIIDVGFDPEVLIQLVRRANLRPVRIVLTHAHLDHIAGVRQVLDAFGPVVLAIHEAEADFLLDPNLNLSSFVEMNITTPPADELLRDGQVLTLGDAQWKVLHTPGHSPGGITLYHAPSNQAIVGDTLFAGSVGRYDFPTSDGALLFRSIREKLLTLPDETRIYPGHGPETTIGRERRTNPFLADQ